MMKNHKKIGNPISKTVKKLRKYFNLKKHGRIQPIIY